MSIPAQPTSRKQLAPPGSLEALLRASRAYVREFPKHARWLLEGHPTMTHEEHHERFGKVYKRQELT